MLNFLKFCCARSFDIEALNEINGFIAFVNDVGGEILLVELILDVCGVRVSF